MLAQTDLFDPSKRDEVESALIKLIQEEDLLTWIYGNTKTQGDTEDFLRQVCRTLDNMQTKGLITGFRAAALGGQMLPIVSCVKMVLPTAV